MSLSTAEAVDIIGNGADVVFGQARRPVGHDAETRVTRFLERRASKEAGAAGPDLPEPRIAIAARLGMTPETLSRTLTALEKKGKLSRPPAAAGGRRAEG